MNRGVKKFQSLYFKGKLIVNSKVGLPAQTSKEINMFKALFDSLERTNKTRIFEWGSGGSTIYYANYLRRKGIEFEWHSIDNNKSWYEKIKSEMKKKELDAYVQVYLKEFRPFWEKPGWGQVPPACGVFSPKSENEQAYINFPRLLNKRFDIVIIDARFRRHCIETAQDVLRPNGIAIMHDAEKPHYHIGLDSFKYNRFYPSGSWYPLQEKPNQVWVGSMDNQKIFETLNQI